MSISEQEISEFV